MLTSERCQGRRNERVGEEKLGFSKKAESSGNEDVAEVESEIEAAGAL